MAHLPWPSTWQLRHDVKHAIRVRPRYAPLVTHDELRALLGAYAAGALSESAAEAVRAHLASGCKECLHDVFSRPVGLQPTREAEPAREVTEPPRDVPETPATSVPPARRVRRGRRWGLVVAIVLLALALATFASWTIYDLREREAAHHGEAVRLAARVSELETARAELNTARAELNTRIEALGQDREAAREEAVRQAEAVRATAEENASLKAELEAARARIATLSRGVQRRDTEISQLLAGGDEERVMRELAATPGLELVRLRPIPPVTDAGGHVLWHPARDTLVLYAFDLPPLAEGARYRVRLRLGDGRVEEGPVFRPGPRGDVALPIRVNGGPLPLREVQVVRDATAEPVLVGQTRSLPAS